MRIMDFIKAAFKNLFKRKLRTSLTIVAICIGTMLLMVMTSLGFGAQQFLMDSIRTQVNLSSLQVFPVKAKTIDGTPVSPGQTITAKSNDDFKMLTENDIEKMKKIRGVSEVKSIVITDPVTITIEKRTAGDTHAAGYDVKYGVFAKNFIEGMRLAANNRQLKPIIAGRNLEVSDKNSALVNVQYLKRLGISDYKSVIGKNMIIEAAKSQIVNSEDSKKSFKAKIVGVVDANFFSAGDLIIPIKLAGDIQGFLSDNNNYLTNNGPQQLIVYTNSFKDVSGVSSKIKQIGYTTATKDASISQIKKLSAILMVVMASVGVIILAIAAIGVINTMFMSIYERTRSIGVMKSLGASNRDIRNLFLVESGVIGFLGGILGAIAGIVAIEIMQTALSGYLYSQGFTSVNLLSIQVSIVFGSIAFSATVALLSGLYPAKRAARLNPIEALRYE